MPSPDSNTIRLVEWSPVNVSDRLNREQRRQIDEAVTVWKEQNDLTSPPLSFSGSDGECLNAIQYVGVVEVAGVTIEIYPKLDAEFGDEGGRPTDPQVESVMSNLLWMIATADFAEMVESDTARLNESPFTFYDLFAFLMAKNVMRELENGIPHNYVGVEDDCHAIRGRIRLMEQVAVNFDRMDRIKCAWDEYTPDIALNRLFKCACRILSQRVGNPVAVTLMTACIGLLDEVEDVSPLTALRDVEFIRWGRANERFRTCFDMARRMLRGCGYHLGHGDAETFVFLIDMNQLFEKYAEVVLASFFEVSIECQQTIGHLFRDPERIQQKPDYIWKTRDERQWIGDAKYKHLAKGTQDSLRFRAIPGNNGEDNRLAGDVISTQDVRQLTVYAELLRRDKSAGANRESSALMVLYPFVGTGRFEAACATAWNDSIFWLVPLRVKRAADLKELLPPNTGIGEYGWRHSGHLNYLL